MRPRRRRGSFVRAACDALERRLLLSTYYVTTAADSGPGSLRDAITNSSADTINFDLQPDTKIVLKSQLEITRNLNLFGPDYETNTIDGNHATRVLQVDPNVSVQITDLTIGDGAADYGAAIFNSGTLWMQSCTISNNAAKTGTALGGGIANA